MFFAFIVSFVPLLTKRWGAAAGARSDKPANELRSDAIAPVAATTRCRLDEPKRIKNGNVFLRRGARREHPRWRRAEATHLKSPQGACACNVHSEPGLSALAHEEEASQIARGPAERGRRPKLNPKMCAPA